MAEEFGQTANPIAALRAILGSYPYSVGLIRELLQNSDDAGATRQILVLDRRTHEIEGLYHEDLQTTQGPALLAFNNAEFAQNDWTALRSAFESSKIDDSSKIGKYGVGFRSVFHITDCPQIISGKHMAIFDPLQAFIGSDGVKTELNVLSSRCAGSLAPFKFFASSIFDKFDGTIIRCPLRTCSSRINSRIIATNDIAHLFKKFIEEELEISLLFLQNIQHLEIHDIDERGVSTCLATLSISRSPSSIHSVTTVSCMLSATTTINSLSQQKTWRLVQCSFDKDDVIEFLSKNFAVDPTAILKEHKLLPNIGLAMPLQSSIVERTSGRLFTYLPLPIPTGFPQHIHALFALTQSRQNLRNSKEVGIVPGSTDHVLIEWNQHLFDRYIPLAWSHLLEMLAKHDDNLDIFLAWPPEQRSLATTGESVYWKFLPLNVFSAITSSNYSVWPLYRQPSEYKSLDLLIAAGPSISNAVLDVLTLLGLHLTRPPLYIFKLIESSNDRRFTILTPEVAHTALLTYLDFFQRASKEQLLVLLEYLLSTGNICNIVDLPLITVKNREIVALTEKQTTAKTHTLLRKDESGIFGTCDGEAIELASLPYQIAQKLESLGPAHLNVELLSVPRIVHYLTIYPNRMGLDLSLIRTDPAATRWLSAFWIWMSTYRNKDELFPKIRDLYLLPSTKGLKQAKTFMFKSRGEHPNSVQHLSKVGVCFVDQDLTEPASNALVSFNLLKYISDVHLLLNSLELSGSIIHLADDECKTVLRHFAAHAQMSQIRHGPFNQTQYSHLRSLPIFPLVSFVERLEVRYEHLSDDISYRSVGNVSFLPRIKNMEFLQLNDFATPILDYLEPSGNPISRLAEPDILSLTLDHFAVQPLNVQAAALDYMVRNTRTVTLHVLNKVREAKFVIVKGGGLESPKDVVDPDSDIAQLFYDDDLRMPRRSSISEKDIIRSLQFLGRMHGSVPMMRNSLTLDIMQERIDYINNSTDIDRSTKLSKNLLELVIKYQYTIDFSNLQVTPQQQWLPTNNGLRGYGECRDPDYTHTPRYLFDKVLSVFQPFKLPTSLIKVFGWDQLLPTWILIEQFGRVLVDDDTYTFSAILQLTQQLSSRTDCDFDRLRQLTTSRTWVPTTEQELVETQDAVFTSPIAGSGFHQALCINSEMKCFLQLMGVTDSPTAGAVVQKLEDLNAGPLDLPGVHVSISLLRSLPLEIDAVTKSRILVPDIDAVLRPITQVYFNDIGHHSRLIPLESEFIAHPMVEETLTMKLDIKRLGLKSDIDYASQIDMGEKPITTVHKILSQYTEKQFATEFLANAVDAGATECALMLNGSYPHDDGNIRALSSTMAKFCTSPSLVVYNNAMFSKKDIKGVQMTNVGGKRESSKTIGQFGVGALTMFHFTELAIIVTGDKVLFLNPSMQHLPVPGRASLLLSLATVRKYYSSHLVSINGLFNFDLSSVEPYNGTIFILPLRQSSHIEGPSHNFVSTVLRHEYEIKKEILEDFSGKASMCLFFTRIKKISALVRQKDLKGHPEELEVLWRFWADADLPELESATDFASNKLSITDKSGIVSTWLVASASIPRSQVPGNILSSLEHRYRLRLPVLAGLAAQLQEDGAPEKPSVSNFFSILPLGITNSLPLHVMATFLLSSDRRSIRSPAEDAPESEFNKWLLSEIIPELYLFLLEVVVRECDNKRLWPLEDRATNDLYSRIIVDQVYSAQHLRSSPRHVFSSHYVPGTRISATDVVLSGEEPSAVQKALGLLRSPAIAKLSRGAYRLAKKHGVAVMTPKFVASEIIKNPAIITSELTVKELDELIQYLLNQGGEEDTLGEEYILGLPILPLHQDNSFGIFKNREESPNYFIWRPRRENHRHNFPQDRFVHPDLKITHVLLKLPLNISILNPPAIKQFVSEKLPQRSTFDATREQSEWIDNFWNSWEEYATLGMHYDELADYPLVPTVNPTRFVSLSSCKNGHTIIIEGTLYESVRVFLDHLNVNVVRLDGEHVQTPPSLYYILLSSDFSSFNFENVLRALSSVESVIENIRNLDQDLQEAFAIWARQALNTHIPLELQPLARQLPIWPSAKYDLPNFPALRPASDVFMLPENFPLSIAAQFINVYVAEFGSLVYLDGPRLTPEELQSKINIPISTTLLPSQLQDYGSFLRTWLPLLPTTYTDPVPVPDTQSIIKLSSELYSREGLFQAAFGNAPEFIHADLAYLEPFLKGHGLRTESQLDFSMFMSCVQAFQYGPFGIGASDEDSAISRANTIFQSYASLLPTTISHADENGWRQFDDFNFIPRHMGTKRRLENQHSSVGFHLPQNIISLDRIVSPSDLIRKEFEPIAWTQRAFFETQPDRRVILEYPDLGRPSIREVVTHLSVLASMSRSGLSDSQRDIVVHDVKEIYTFLNQNSAASAVTIAGWEDPSSSAMFLNIDDPESDTWRWDSIDNLVFETQDVDEHLHHVCKFLSPFNSLLSDCGVLSIHHPQYPNSSLNDPGLTAIAFSSSFRNLRENKILTDVIFIADDHIEGSEPVAHRAFLAACSDYFADAFSGGYEEAREASSLNPIRFTVQGYSRQSIEIILDYAYTGSRPPIDRESLHLFLEILKLANMWHMTDVFEDVQRELATEWIKPRFLERIQEAADSANAENLRNMCVEYEEKNPELIRRYNERAAVDNEGDVIV